MDLIQDNALATQAVQKALGFEHRSTDARQFTVEIFNLRKVLAQAGLSDAANTREPDNRPVLPCPVEQFQPEMSMYHMQLYFHTVAPNVTAVATLSDADSTGPHDIASARLQAMLEGLDDQSRETVDSIVNSERSSRNLRKLTLTWNAPPEHLYIDGIQVPPADAAGKQLLLPAQSHSIVALRGNSLAVVQLSSSAQTQTVPLVFQPFAKSRVSELVAFESARKPIEILLRTTNSDLQPRSSDVAIYHWTALHLLHLDSCIRVSDWNQIPPDKRGEVQRWQRSGEFLNGW